MFNDLRLITVVSVVLVISGGLPAHLVGHLHTLDKQLDNLLESKPPKVLFDKPRMLGEGEGTDGERKMASAQDDDFGTDGEYEVIQVAHSAEMSMIHKRSDKNEVWTVGVIKGTTEAKVQKAVLKMQEGNVKPWALRAVLWKLKKKCKTERVRLKLKGFKDLFMKGLKSAALKSAALKSAALKSAANAANSAANAVEYAIDRAMDDTIEKEFSELGKIGKDLLEYADEEKLTFHQLIAKELDQVYWTEDPGEPGWLIFLDPTDCLYDQAKLDKYGLKNTVQLEKESAELQAKVAAKKTFYLEEAAKCVQEAFGSDDPGDFIMDLF